MAVLGWFALGCAEEPPEPFGYLNVRATGQLPQSEGELRAVLIWWDSNEGGPGVATTDDAAIDAEAPFEFGMAVRPTESAESNANDIDGPITRGNLIAYLDRDGNGRFSWTEPSAGGFRDLVIGWVPGLRMVYVPMPSEYSEYQRGFTFEMHTRIDDYDTTSEVIDVQSEIALHTFDIEETACLGMSPIIQYYPPALSAKMASLDPVPALVWPYPVGAPPCPGAVLPDDWWDISCSNRPGGYLVRVLEWPADPDIADLCGWTISYCVHTVDEGVEPPPEYPSCDWS